MMIEVGKKASYEYFAATIPLDFVIDLVVSKTNWHTSTLYICWVYGSLCITRNR